MTPAIIETKKSKTPFTVHQYDHDPSCESYGAEAANKIGIAEEKVFKTLVVELATKELVVGIIPVSSKLNMKLIAKAYGAKKAGMAGALTVERTTGYVLGGVSPLGQKKKLRTIIDVSAAQYSTIFVSAGRRGLELELNPQDLKTLTNAGFVEVCL
jgi:Cys-tRNA(Pro)/Cys-tRNA(Cys) deacylase